MTNINIPNRQHGGINVGVDDTSNYLICMSEIHALIHNGIFYTVSWVDISVNNNSTLGMYINPNGQSIHLRAEAQTGGDARFRIFEGTTFTNVGTTVVPVNRNRYSSNIATSEYRYNPTVDDVGTILYDKFGPGGIGRSQSVGHSSGMFEEFIFKNDTLYYIEITNIAGSSQPVSLVLDFYEPDD
jgi:hypothetical protein